MLPEVPPVKSLCLGECLEGLSCPGQCRTITWSTVTPLNMFLKMQFLDVWGSLETMKRNFSLCDFEAHPNRWFQLYFLSIFLRSPAHWKVKCHEGRTLPGSAWNAEGTRFIRRGLGEEGMMIPTSPCAPVIHSSSSLIPAGCARLVAARANSRGGRAVFPWN